MTRASYGGHESPPRLGPIVLGVLTVATIAHVAIYEWGDFKVSKMLPAYPYAPRTVDNRGVLHSTHLESQLAKAQRRIAELTRDAMPEERETLEEERERWQEQKEHLLARIAELEEKILLVVNANGEHTSNDSAFIGRLAEGVGL